MAKRVGVILSGCGALDGSEVREAVLTLLSVERAGAEIVCAAPDAEQSHVVDHLAGTPVPGHPRRVLAEAARIARGKIRPLSALDIDDVDALIFPGGQGVATVLSTYALRGELCEVHPDVVRLLKGALSSHCPIGLICLAPILAARVLGPVAGVRLTLGARGTAPAKHAAVMGADVRPCPVQELVIDQKARVVSTPAYMYDDATLPQVAAAIDKLARTVLSMARDRRAGAVSTPARVAQSAAAPKPILRAASPAGAVEVRPKRRVITPDRGSA